jgi:hypothetical protein
MRRLFACSVACWFLAGCSESDPVETPSDAADASAVETSIDSTIDSGADETAVDSGDAADTQIDSALDGDATSSDAMDGEVATDSRVGDVAADAAIGDAAADSATGDVASDADVATDSAVGDVASSDTTDALVVTPELWVVRVGDGVAALDVAALPVAIDRVLLSTGAVLGSIALPTAASGADHPFTLAGIGAGDGQLTRSADGRYVTMAGYAATPGTDEVANTSTVDPPAVPRVVARIDGAGAVSTSTTITNLFDGGIVRSAVTDNGTRFWLTGTGNNLVYLGGFGAEIAGTSIATGITGVRFATLIDGSLYGNSNIAANVFDFATPLPTTASTPTTVLGSSSLSPYGMVGFARGSSGADLIYVCDSRAASSGGGLQRWTKTSSSWSLAANLAPSPTTGCHAIAGSFAGGLATLYVTTAATPASVVKFVDDPAATVLPTPVTILTAEPKKAIRGIALRPTP